MGMLATISTGGNVTFNYHYTRNSKLLQSKVDSSGNGQIFEYDRNGRIKMAVSPIGESFHFKSDLGLRGAIVNITNNSGQNFLSLLMQPKIVQTTSPNGEIEVIRMNSDQSFVVDSKWGAKFSLRTSPFRFSSMKSKLKNEKSFPVPKSERTEIGGDTVNLFEWQFLSNGGIKKLKVNGKRILGLESSSKSQLILMEESQIMLNASHGSQDQLKANVNPIGLFAPLAIQNNRNGQIQSWRWGELEMDFVYDQKKRLQEVKNGLTYVYDQDPSSTLPHKVVLPSGGGFHFPTR